MSRIEGEISDRREWVYLDTGEVVEMTDADHVIATLSVADERADVIGPLLAAAPEMLDALKQQSVNIKRWLATGVLVATEESKLISNQIDAAIAKAEGWA